MIAAISVMKRRPDLSSAEFREHWLDPHGVMTAKLPGVRYYVQSHCLDAPGTNALARTLDIDGFPELWFDSYEARRVAYNSPRIAECNADSEQFVGSVSRLVTEPMLLKTSAEADGLASVILIATGRDDAGWSERLKERTLSSAGVVGYVAHRVLEQAAAPNSKIPELKLVIGGFAKVTFVSETALMKSIGALTGDDGDTTRVAIFRVQDYLLAPDPDPS